MRPIKIPLKSITQKVLTFLVIGIVFIMAAAGGTYYAAEKQKALRHIQDVADKTADRTSNSLIYPLWNISKQEIEKTLSLEMAEESIIAIILNDEDGQFLMGNIKDSQGRILNYKPDGNQDTLTKKSHVIVKKSILKGSEYLGEVHLFFTDRYLNLYLHDLIIKIILLTALLSAITFLIIFFSLKMIILAPLISLQKATQRLKTALSDGVYTDYRVMSGTGDEIDTLGQNFNAMADDLIASQARLQHTVGRLQSLTDETPDAVITINSGGKILDVNKTFVKMFGGTYDAFPGTPLDQLAAMTAAREVIHDNIKRVMQGHSVDFEWYARRNNGESFPVAARFRLMQLGDERLILAVITDITESKRQEEALISSEAKHRRLVDKLGREYFFYTHDTAGVFTYLSPSASDMLGYTQDELKTHYATYLTDAPINQEAVEKTNLSLQGIKQPPYQAEMRDKSGCPVWLEVSESPIFDVNGRVVAVEGIAHDITGRKLAQEALRESEARFRSLFEKSADAVLLIEDGQFIDCNQAAIDMLRASSNEQLIHCHPSQLSPACQPDGLRSTEKAEQMMVKALAEGSTRFEWIHRRFNGEDFPVEVLLTSIPAGKRRLIHVVWRDITESKAAEEALLTSESRLRTIGDNLPGGMIYQLVIAPDGTRRFTYISRGVEKMHGFIADDVIKDPSILYNQIAEEDRPGLIREEDRCIRQMETFNMEARSCLPSGLIRWMKITSQPRRLSTGEIVFDGVEMDITDRKQAEQDLRESEERFSKAFRSNPAPMAITEIETGRYLDANDRWLNLTGYSREELIGHTSLELNVYVDTGTRERLVALLRKEGFFKEADLRLRRKSGQILDVLWTAEIINLSGQEAMLSVLIDITERKQAEKRLLESLGLLQATLESAADGILVTDLDAHIVNYNQRFVELMQIPGKILASGDDPAVLKVILKQLKEPDVFLDSLRHLYNHPEVEHHEVNHFLDGRIFERYSIPTFRGDEIVGRVWSFRDVTKTKKTEEALLLTQFSVDSASDSILWLDEDANLIYANDAVCTALGYTREELLSMNIHALDPDFPPEAWPPHVEELRRRKAITFESGHRTKDGCIFPVEVTCNYFEYNGHFYSFSFDRDITLRKQAEEALRESEALFRSQFEFGNIGIAITSPEKGWLRVNRCLCDMFGYAEAEMLCKTWTEMTHPEDVEPDLLQFNRMLAGEIEAYEMNKRFLRKDGSIISTHLSVSCFRNPDRSVRFVIASLLDISDSVRSLERLHTSETTIRALMNATADALFVTDQEGILLALNTTLASRFGKTTEEMMGSNIYTYLPTDLAAERRKSIETVIETGQPVHFVDQRRDLWLENTFYPIFNDEGRVALIAAYSRDVTLQKEAEIKLQQYHEELESQVKQRTLQLSAANANLIRFRSFAEASGQGFGMATLDGTIVYANAALRRMIGKGDLDKEMSASFLDRYPKAYQEKLRDEIIPLVLEDGQWIGELALVDTAGHVIPTIENYFLIRDENGNPTLIADVITDIQDMKRAEKELKKYRDHLEELVKKRTRDLQQLNESLTAEIDVRIRTEEALRASEERYRTLFDSAPIGISVMRPDMTFEYFNPRFTEMFGYELADLPDKDTWFRKAYPDADYRRHVTSLWKDDLMGNTNNHKIGERLLRVRTKDDHEKMIHFRTAVLENGEHLMSYEDVTELQDLNDALRDSEARYRTLFENAPVAIGLATVSGHFIAVNEGLVQLFRAPSMGDVLRMDVNDIYPDRAERPGLLKRILQDGAVRNHETVFRRLDGTTVDVIMTMSLFKYAGQDTILSVVQDITWRKQAEEETRHLKNYLANIIDSMPSVLVGVDRESLVTQWNISAERYTGIKADDARNKRLGEVLPFMAHQVELVREALRTNRPQAHLKMQSLINGENRYTDITVYPLVTNGVEGCVVRIDDVTDRVRIEEMMIQSEKMLSVGGLAAGMAHEINNPLGIVQAAAQNVLRRVSPDLTANIKEAEACGVPLSTIRAYLEKRQVLTFLEDIRIGVTRASQIVANMLSFSRKAEEGGQPENLADLLDQTVLLAGSDYDLKKKYDFRQIEMVREYDPATPLVLCQASKIQQVFLNILRNGAEAMEETHPPRFILRVFPDGQWVQIEIEDNGPGMEEATRRRVFEPFFTTKPPGVGTGLGLSVSYFIITENHGGAIAVESTPGTGARFFIRLPAMEK
jgi:PAS domain S-box-containing protein